MSIVGFNWKWEEVDGDIDNIFHHWKQIALQFPVRRLGNCQKLGFQSAKRSQVSP